MKMAAEEAAAAVGVGVGLLALQNFHTVVKMVGKQPVKIMAVAVMLVPLGEWSEKHNDSI